MNQPDLNGHIDQRAVAALITLPAPLLVFILFQKCFATRNLLRRLRVACASSSKNGPR